MNEWINEGTNERMNERTNERTNQRMIDLLILNDKYNVYQI
jgi:ATP-dependent Clp protease adapter protein ClpS